MTEPSFEELVAGCAREPIHVPEAVQTFGALVAVDGAGTVVAASANAPDLLGVDAVPGAALAALGLGIQPDEFEPGSTATVATAQGLLEVRVTRVAPAGADRSPDSSGPLTVLEVEPVDDVVLPADAVYPALRALTEAGDLTEVLQVAVVRLRAITGFDRVMAYRFDADWNGEVVAEDVGAGQEPYLGLRYPAADIPPQARALYARSHSRLIADVDDPTAALVHLDAARTAPLDLSDVAVRSVSPVHLQYLRNMGVGASMSLSLMVEGRLWGLLACHHPTRHHLDPARRQAAALVAQLVSTRLAGFTERRRLARRAEAGEALAVVRGRAEAAGELARELVEATELRELLGATGITIAVAGQTATAGDAPPVDEAARIARRLLADGPAEGPAEGPAIGAEHALAWDLPVDGEAPGAPEGPRPAGALAVALPGPDAWVVWWRPEVVHEVRWAGEPRTKEAAVDADGRLRLHPRQSFRTYVERVAGQSRRWDDHDRWVAGEVARQVTAVLAGRTRLREATRSAVLHVLGVDDTRGVRGLDVAVRSQPAGGAPLGGDWHDVVPLPDGSVALAVGDVAGHGFEVAGAMAHLRHALRAYLVAYGDASTALARLDELVQQLLPGEVATALVCQVAPDGGAVTVASTGHLPPILVRDEGAELCAVGPSPAVGLPRRRDIPTTRVDLAAGEVMVLFTDGLVERRHRALDHAIAGLVDDLGRLGGRRPEEICDVAVRARLGDADDDVTVVAFSPVAGPLVA